MTNIFKKTRLYSPKKLVASLVILSMVTPLTECTVKSAQLPSTIKHITSSDEEAAIFGTFIGSSTFSNDDIQNMEEVVETPLSDQQRNSINLLNYMTVLTQEINAAKDSRLFLENTYFSLLNDTHPNAIDSRTEAQMHSILDTIEQYRMISVKRERIEYIHEQNRAQALRQAIPDPVGLLSSVTSGSPLKAAASILYMTIDSASKYASATSQATMQQLKDGWELDDEENAELHKSRKNALSYMLSMVRDNNLPGDYALNEDSVAKFVEWKNESNLESKILWFESHESTYKMFGQYWLELAKNYYENGNYQKCIDSIEQYTSITSKIFRQDCAYAEVLPLAIISAKETMSIEDYIEYANTYAPIILKNTKDDNWALRYIVAQLYIDLYTFTNDTSYLEYACDIVFNSINILKKSQLNLNEEYLAGYQKIKAEKDATKREKKEIRQYNKLQKEHYKTAVPPVNEALYLNCDLLFALADKLHISKEKQNKIDAVLHENDKPLFLTTVLDNKFWFSKRNDVIDTNDIPIEFDGDTLLIPANYITEQSDIYITISNNKKEKVLDDWKITNTERPKKGGFDEYLVTLKSETAKDYKYKNGDHIKITIIPVKDSPEYCFNINYKVDISKIAKVIKDTKFKKVTAS